jgi:GNAT superfamily N-acetyltransferase
MSRTRAEQSGLQPAEGIGVRAVRESDFDAWQPLWDGYNAFYGRSGATALPAEITATTWKRFFDPAEPVHGLVAELDGGLVGLCHYLFHRSTTSIAPICYLQDLFTDPQVRGRGVGRALIEAAYELAQQAGARRVYWQTHESNLVAQRLYNTVAERSGFLVYRKDL